MNQPIPPTTLASLLNHVTAPCPFDYLGLHPHPSGNGLVLRTWQPYAKQIEVIQIPENKSLGVMTACSHGLFEIHLEKLNHRFNYQLQMQFPDNEEICFYDPYQFGEYILKQQDIEPQALYRHIGAFPHTHQIDHHTTVEGVLFKVYAPNASSVSVVGAFNNWDGRIHPMASADDGIWRLFIPDIESDSFYKFELHDNEGKLLPLKSDPFARYSEQWPDLASIIHSSANHHWQDNQWMNSRYQGPSSAMSVYEIHAGSWKRNPDNSFMSYRELADELIPYVKEMGFTHIQLMPVAEHPDYESWGYQPVGLFAPSSRYGSPDDLKFFIDQCHQNNLGVLMDWVPARFPADKHGLAQFDGSALYEYKNPQRGWHPEWQTHVYDYGSQWVQNFLISNALFWLDEFHIDGLHIDALSSMLYLDYAREPGNWKPNEQGGNEHVEAVDFIRNLNESIRRFFPDCITIAEETTNWPGVTKPVKEGGLGFSYQNNDSWLQDSTAYIRRPTHKRSYHHNQMILSSLYSHSANYVLSLTHESAVNGKGTLLSQLPGNTEGQFANLRAYFANMFTHPGKKFLFMGTELASENEWSIHQPLDWSILSENVMNAGFSKLIKDLNQLYRKIPSLHQLDHQAKGFRWVIMDDHKQSVFSFLRYDQQNQPVLVISNMAEQARTRYQLGVPVEGVWTELLSTDDQIYGGNDRRNGPVSTEEEARHGYNQAITLSLPPLSTLILVPEAS